MSSRLIARMLPELNSLPNRLVWPALLLLLRVTVASVAVQPLALPATGMLTNAAQLRALPAVTAALQLPVSLRVTVTAFNPSSVFIQDETGGTFLNFPTGPAGLSIGDVLDVVGVSYPGRFLPGVGSVRFQVVDHGDLPAATPVTFEELLSARRHYERVEVNGIVRSITLTPASERLISERLVLYVALGTRKLEVQIATTGLTNLPALADARVRIVGLAAGYINNRRQLLAPQLLVNQLADVQVVKPPPADPFGVPLTASSALLNFDPAGVSQHRVRVHGVVTHRQADEALYLRDADHGLLVQTAQLDLVNPGDVVEVVGFPAIGRFSAFLEDAEFRITGHAADPRPLPTSLTEALTGMNDANLITLDAQVLEVLETPAESVLVLRAENMAFRARMPRATLTLGKDTTVRLTGVCRAEEFSPMGAGFGANPRSIELLLRSPADVTVLTAPSGWTAQRLAVAAGILLGVALVAFIWVALLRRRVTEQAGVIREKIRREAALEERHRMAREMHDTLAQSFSGLGFQLEALNTRLPTEAMAARSQLEIAQQMVRHGQEGFRRSLLNLRSQELERGSLTEALQELARHITAGTGIELNCEVQCPERGLSEAIEANLLRIGQECLGNAVRHGHPKHIDLLLKHEAGIVQLRITDDGVGFDPAELNHASNGHFGWRGIRERAEQLGATVELQAQPGRGTSVTVNVPI